MGEELRRFQEARAAHAAATERLMRLFHVLAALREEDRAALRGALDEAQREHDAASAAVEDARRALRGR